MKIICNECGSPYKINDELIKGKTTIKSKCPNCKFIQKNELIKKKESNPFEDSSKTVDFIESIKNKNKNLNSNEFDFSDESSNKQNKSLPDIDLETLQREEIKEKVDRALSNSVTKKEDSKLSALKETKGLYSAKKGGRFLGPFTLDEIKIAINKRKITKEFLFSKNGDDWKTVDSYRELLPFFKEVGASSNAKKYLIIGIILIIIAYVLVALLDKFTNDDYKIVTGINNNSSINATNKLDLYINNWKKTVILTKNSDSMVYAHAIQDFYYDSPNSYIKAANQFKEVLVKNHLKYDAFYYLILCVSFSDVNIEKVDILRKYLKTLKSIKNSKKHNELYYNALSALSLKLGLFVDSFNYAEETKNLVSNNAIANYLLGRFYLNSKKIDKTIKFLKISIESDDRLIIAKKFLAKTFLDSEMYKRAISFYKKKSTIFSKLILAKIYLKIGYYDKSFLILKKINKMKDTSTDKDKANILYAKLLYQYKNNNRLALRILKKIEKRTFFKLSQKDKLLLLNIISTIYRINKNYSKSIKYSNKINQIEQNNRFAKFNLILIRIRQKKYKEASILIKQFNSITKNSDKYNYLINFELFLSRKEYAKAIKEIKQVINIEKYNNIYYILLADIYAKQNKLNMLQEALLDLSNVNPDYYINNYYKLTNIYIRKYNLKFLLNYLEDSLKIKNIDKALIANNLGLVNFQIKKFSKAIYYLSKSLNLSQRNISNYLYLSYANYELKNYNEVAKISDMSYKFGKNKYIYLIHMKALLKLKKNEEAKKLLKSAEFDFEYSNTTKIMKALLYISEGKENFAKDILNKFKDDYIYDLSFRKFLFSLDL